MPPNICFLQFAYDSYTVRVKYLEILIEWCIMRVERLLDFPKRTVLTESNISTSVDTQNHTKDHMFVRQLLVGT